MKVLYLCPDLGIPVLGRKGAAVHVRELAGAFARAGHSVVLASQVLNKSPWETPAEVPFPVVQVRSAPSTAAAVLALKQFTQLLGLESSTPGELRRILHNQELESDLSRRFEKEPPDLLYERASLYATAGIMLARIFGAPLFVELNAPLAAEQAAYRQTGFGELAAQAERWTLTHADGVVVVSSELKQHVLSLGVGEQRIHVLPNGVNTRLFHPAPRDLQFRNKLGLDGGLVIGFVGGLRPWHGVEILPELFERLSRKHPSLRLLIAGDGPLRPQLESEIQKRGLASKALITGLVPHEQVPDFIRQFDVALAPYPKPSHSFYFSPLKIFEYMACGIPVVAPDLGQIAEVVHNRESGMLYPANDLDALLTQCDTLLNSTELRAELGTTAARIVQGRFTWDHNARKIIEIFHALPARNKTQAENVLERRP